MSTPSGSGLLNFRALPCQQRDKGRDPIDHWWPGFRRRFGLSWLEIAGRPLNAFFVGLAASLGAAISMGLSEALSDDGSVTGRGGPLRRGMITGVATGIGGMLHTFPFLIPNLRVAHNAPYAVAACELVAIAFTHCRFMGGKLRNTVVQIAIGGAVVLGIGVWLGRIGAC